MRILIVSQYYYPERFCINEVAEGLLSLGHEVEVITGQPNYGFDHKLKEYRGVKEETINGVKVHRVHLFARRKNRLSVIFNYLSFYSSSLRFVKHFKKEFDIVLSFSLSPVISIAAANKYAKIHNIPSVLFCMDLWPESTTVTGAVKKGSLIYKMLYNWSVKLYSDLDHIIVSSPSFINYFKNKLHIDKPFTYINQPVLKAREKLPPVTYETKYNFVYAGNIGKIQLIDELVESMKYVKTKDVTLHLTGMGSESNKIIEKINNEGLKDKVIYHGPLPLEKVESYFINADALIVSLKNEGTVGKTIPNKLVQYLSNAKPIIGVIHGDGRDLLRDAKGALLAEEDPKDIAKQIDKICSYDEVKKAEMAKSNLDFFNANLKTERINYLINEVLTELIK